MHGVKIAQPDELAAGIVHEERVAFEIGDTDEFSGGGDKRRQHARKAIFFPAGLAKPPDER
jgi:hypothetical protein